MTKQVGQVQPHILLVTFPAQGHINPALQFANRLLRLGVRVTFATSVSAYRKMKKAGRVPEYLNYAVFSDGFDDGYKGPSGITSVFLTQFKTRGSESLKETICSSAKDGHPVTGLVYTLLLPWAAAVARELNVPSALLWIQPAAVLDIYYYYFDGYNEVTGDGCNDPSWTVEFPGLPVLRSRDLPSFCLPSNTYVGALPLFREQMEVLNLEEHPMILVNTFDALERETLRAVDKLNMIAVGPLVPSVFMGGEHRGGDLFETSKEPSKNYLEWMKTKPAESIVYISFGSIITLTMKQKKAIARALLECGKPFLWVIRAKEAVPKEEKEKDGVAVVVVEEEEEEEEEEGEISCVEELGRLGMIVPWCSQLEVLSHPSLGCFVTHCGWNSTLESVICGVPVVAFPHWTDQGTNAKFLEDVWGTGVRVRENEEGVVESEEIRRCIELVMGGHEKAVTMRKNAKEWKDLGREAMKEGGSSDMNLKAFVESIGGSTENRVLSSGGPWVQEPEPNGSAP